VCQKQLCIIYRTLWNWLSALRYRNWKTTCLFILRYWDSVLPQASRNTDIAEEYKEGPSYVQQVGCIKTEPSWTAVWVTSPAMSHTAHTLWVTSPDMSHPAHTLWGTSPDMPHPAHTHASQPLRGLWRNCCHGTLMFHFVVSQSVGQSVSRSVSQSVGQSVGQSVSRSVCCPSSSHSPLTTTNPVQQNTLHLNSFPRRQNPSDKCRPLVAPPTPGTCLGTEHVVRIKLARWRSLCYQSCGTTCTA
jgi:hypothetical protein